MSADERDFAEEDYNRALCPGCGVSPCQMVAGGHQLEALIADVLPRLEADPARATDARILSRVERNLAAGRIPADAVTWWVENLTAALATWEAAA